LKTLMRVVNAFSNPSAIISSDLIYCAIKPQSGIRPNVFISEMSASRRSPLTFSK